MRLVRFGCIKSYHDYDRRTPPRCADIEDMQAEYREMFRGGGGYDEERLR